MLNAGDGSQDYYRQLEEQQREEERRQQELEEKRQRSRARRDQIKQAGKDYLKKTRPDLYNKLDLKGRAAQYGKDYMSRSFPRFASRMGWTGARGVGMGAGTGEVATGAGLGTTGAATGAAGTAGTAGVAGTTTAAGAEAAAAGGVGASAAAGAGAGAAATTAAGAGGAAAGAGAAGGTAAAGAAAAGGGTAAAAAAWPVVVGVLIALVIIILIFGIAIFAASLKASCDTPGAAALKDSALCQGSGGVGGSVPASVSRGGVSDVSRWDADIRRIAAQNSLEYCYVKSFLEVESGGNPNAIGHDHTAPPPPIKRWQEPGDGRKATEPRDAHDLFSLSAPPKHNLDWQFSHGIGLMQITIFPYDKDPNDWINSETPSRKFPPNTGTKKYTVLELLNPIQSIELGTKYLKDLVNTHKDFQIAAARYNGDGPIADSYGARIIDRTNRCLASKSP